MTESSLSESEEVGEDGVSGDELGMVTGCGSGVAEGDGTVIVWTAVGEEAGYGGLIITRSDRVSGTGGARGRWAAVCWKGEGGTERAQGWTRWVQSI